MPKVQISSNMLLHIVQPLYTLLIIVADWQ